MANPNATAPAHAAQAEKEEVKEVGYSPEEIAYRGRLLTMLVSDHVIRESNHDEFDGMSYMQRFVDDEKRSNSYIPPRQNKEDVMVVTGTTRQKITALAAVVNNLNLTSDITAFDNIENVTIAALGEAMEAILRKTEELELDEIKKLNRVMELLRHGEAFVEENFVRPTEIKKQLKAKFDGKIKSAKWTPRIIASLGRPERNILYGPGVYLGDITRFDFDTQPHVFTVEIAPYAKAESIYGEWERWQFVSRNIKSIIPSPSEALIHFNGNWSLGELMKDHVEIVKFQDPWSNEYMIMINGVMMLPMGFPLPWGPHYNIAHQVNEPISQFFAYGKSTPAKFKTLDSVLDEMLRVMVLKNQRSFAPPIANLTGRVLSNRIFMPGKISNGIDPNDVRPMFEKMEGVTNSEFQMFKEVGIMIDNNSINPQFAGQNSPQAGTTATEILNKQRQSEVQLGLTIFAASMLEKKLALLRIDNLLQNWFDPVDTRIDDVRGGLVNVYRSVSVEGNVPGQGKGHVMVNMIEGTPPSPMAIKESEQAMKDQLGMPVRNILLNVNKLMELRNSARLSWRVIVLSRPKHSS